MKKLIFSSLFVLSAILTFSQTIIPKLGATFAKSGGEYVKGSKFNSGFTVGVAVNVPIGSGSFSLQPELSFVQKGWEIQRNQLLVKNKTRLSGITSFGQSHIWRGYKILYQRWSFARAWARWKG